MLPPVVPPSDVLETLALFFLPISLEKTLILSMVELTLKTLKWYLIS